MASSPAQISAHQSKLSADRATTKRRASVPEKTDGRRPQAPSGGERPMCWTVNATCRQLSISRSTVYCLARAGKLRLIRVAGRTLIPDSEVLRLANEGSEQ
jgi:excisionase family DNA binding protein